MWKTHWNRQHAPGRKSRTYYYNGGHINVLISTLSFSIIVVTKYTYNTEFIAEQVDRCNIFIFLIYFIQLFS